MAWTLIGRPRRIVHYAAECLFLYQTLYHKRRLPEKHVYQVLPTQNIEAIKLGRLAQGNTYFRSTASFAVDIVNLCLLCQIAKPKVVFEIGTANGYTALHFALNTPDDALVYTLDVPPTENFAPALNTTFVDDGYIRGRARPKQYCFTGAPVAEKVVVLQGDSAVFDFSAYHGQVDLFFVDGAHSYDYVRSDTLNALQCCHSGSVIAWHDFGRTGVNGVSRLVLELARDREIYCTPGGSVAFTLVS